MNRVAAIILSLGFCLPAAAKEGQVDSIHGVASVVDGDTLEIRDIRIRLHGVDAPESSQTCTDQQGNGWRCGQQAALALSDRIGRQSVSCSEKDVDRYGRVVAECFMSGDSLNRWLVREGWAVAYRQYSTDYVADEEAAREAARGIWASRFDMPWDWRKGSPGSEAAPEMERLLQFTQRGYSCSPRKTCSAIGSCDEAMWYLENCSWGGKLDRDSDGIPCESIC